MDIAVLGRSTDLSLVLPGSPERTMPASKKVRFSLKEKVRFCCNPDGSIKASVSSKSFTSTLLTETDIEKLWYSTNECRKMELDAHEMAIFQVATNGRYQAAMETILKAVITNVHGSCWAWQLELADLENGPTSPENKGRPTLSYVDAVSLIADTAARGLEPVLMRYLQTESSRLYRRCTEDSATNALSIFWQWRESKNLTEDQKETLLTQRQRDRSNIAARFARALAEGDAKAVSNDVIFEASKNIKDYRGSWTGSSSPRSVMDTPNFSNATDATLDRRRSSLILSYDA